MNKLLIIQET